VRVALVDPPSYTPPYDNSLAAALGRRGHDVTLLASRFLHGPVPEPNGYRREELFFPLSGRLFAARPRSPLRRGLKALEYVPSVVRFEHRLQALDPDVVHVQWLQAPAQDLYWLTRLVRRRPTVLTAHNVVPRRRPRRLETWTRVLGLVDRVVVHSRRAAEEVAALGIATERIVRIPHPMFAAPAEHAITPAHGRTLLFFGLLRAYKGLDLLVRALPQIAREVPDVRVVVAGDPVDPIDGDRALADELGVGGRIEWRLGFVPEPAIAPLLEEATVVVLPYRRTDASGVLANAIGLGRPAVVTDVGALGETVREFGAGAVVPPEDVDALASACVRLLLNGQALHDAVQGTAAARAALTWDAAAEAHEQLYGSIFGTRR
jgi:glycosyltransferase involved in cell wall biosynthesis